MEFPRHRRVYAAKPFKPLRQGHCSCTQMAGSHKKANKHGPPHGNIFWLLTLKWKQVVRSSFNLACWFQLTRGECELDWTTTGLSVYNNSPHDCHPDVFHYLHNNSINCHIKVQINSFTQPWHDVSVVTPLDHQTKISGHIQDLLTKRSRGY